MPFIVLGVLSKKKKKNVVGFGRKGGRNQPLLRNLWNQHLTRGPDGGGPSVIVREAHVCVELEPAVSPWLQVPTWLPVLSPETYRTQQASVCGGMVRASRDSYRREHP